MSVNQIKLESGLICAYEHVLGSYDVAVVFLSGYASDIQGTKAQFLKSLAVEQQFEYLCFDYYGVGQSEGVFTEQSLTTWRQQALDMLNLIQASQIILVGSSMGAWLAYSLVLEYPERFQGLLSLAPAVDFTEHVRPDSVDNFSLEFLRQASSFLLFPKAPWVLACPHIIMHGDQDEVVPLEQGLRVMQACAGEGVSLQIIKNGDHRLSSPWALGLLKTNIRGLVSGLL